MQESAPPFEPIIIDHVIPWEIRIFVFYVLFLLIFFLVRVTQLSWFLSTSRKESSNPTNSELQSIKGRIIGDLALASIRAISLKRAALFTLLLDFTMSSVRGFELLKSMPVARFFGPAAIAGALEILPAFVLGIAVCAAMYATFAIFDGRLSRRKLRLEQRL